VEHIGARDIGTEGNGFKATHTYRLTFTEGVVNVSVKLVASETRTGSKPEWHVQNAPLGVTKPEAVYMSRYGRLKMDLTQEANELARQWMLRESSHQPGLAHGAMLSADRRKADEALIAGVSELAGGVVLAAPVAPDGPAGILELDGLLKSRFFRTDEAGSPFPDAKLAKLREVWASPTLAPASPGVRHPMSMELSASELPTFTVTPTSITVGVQADIIFNAAMHYAPCVIGIECTEPDVIAAVQEAEHQGAAAKDDGTGGLRTLKPRDWRVVWLKTDLESPAPVGPSPLRPGAPRAPGGQ
jgi:hypothetical protein